MIKLTIAEMIERYRCKLADGGMLLDMDKAKKDKTFDLIVANKHEIKAELLARAEAKKKAEEERQAKIDAIEGLAELEATIAASNKYREGFDAMMSDERNDGVFSPKRPKEKVSEVAARYPRASAYITARAWSNAANYRKAGAGKRALERIINGEDYATVLSEMEAEWSAAAAEGMWH